MSCQNFNFVVIYALFPPNVYSLNFRVHKTIVFSKSEKGVELVGGGPVINRAYPIQFSKKKDIQQRPMKVIYYKSPNITFWNFKGAWFWFQKTFLLCISTWAHILQCVIKNKIIILKYICPFAVIFGQTSTVANQIGHYCPGLSWPSDDCLNSPGQSVYLSAGYSWAWLNTGGWRGMGLRQHSIYHFQNLFKCMYLFNPLTFFSS